jgi:uncharacterized lipoprotein YddW (UPF0748 family)
MNRREFVKRLALGGAFLAGHKYLTPFEKLYAKTHLHNSNSGKMKNWAWVTVDLKPTIDEWKRSFALWHESGIDAILLEIYTSNYAFYKSAHLPVKEQWLELLLPIAKQEGLEVHSWMWTMLCNNEDIVKNHPEWFVVNYKGESAANKPSYVNYYKFMCSSRPEVRDFLRQTVTELANYDMLDGVHLDYIRFPDVILAEALQPKYGIKQDKEYPEYDYCYCDLCRSEFQKKTGIDIMKVEDPTSNQEWRQFRYDRISSLVNDVLVPAVHKKNKIVTAAVFPNWEMVRQQWPAWNVDGVLPMLYNGFYNKGIDWIKTQTLKGTASLSGRIPLYSGLFVPQLNPNELAKAIECSLEGNAQGVSLFSAQSMSAKHWTLFKEIVRS